MYHIPAWFEKFTVLITLNKKFSDFAAEKNTFQLYINVIPKTLEREHRCLVIKVNIK
jgi:hypothetical protein